MAGELQKFEQTHIYTAKAPVAQVLQDLKSIHEAGLSISQRITLYKRAFIVSVICAMLSVFIGGVVAQNFSPELGVAVIVVCVLACIILGVLFFSSRKRAFDGRCDVLLARALDFLSRDMPPEAPVQVILDLRSHTHPQKLVRTGKVHQWNVKFYVDKWLLLSGRLLDGTTFRLAATTRWQARSKTKRSSSGKTKWKHKTKESTVLGLRLRFKPERYSHVATIADAKRAVQLPKGVTLRAVATSSDSALLAATLPKWENVPAGREPGNSVSGPHTVAMMFLSLYQVLNLSKELDRAGKAGGGK